MRRLLPALAFSAIVAAGCWGDNPGFEVVASNRSDRAVLVSVEGQAVGDEPDAPAELTLEVPAGTISRKTPWVRVPYDPLKDQWDPGHLRIFSPDCTTRGSYDIEPGTYSLVIDESGALVLTSLGEHPDESTLDLQPAATSCP